MMSEMENAINDAITRKLQAFMDYKHLKSAKDIYDKAVISAIIYILINGVSSPIIKRRHRLNRENVEFWDITFSTFFNKATIELLEDKFLNAMGKAQTYIKNFKIRMYFRNDDGVMCPWDTFVNIP
jgi:hypothetical protein